MSLVITDNIDTAADLATLLIQRDSLTRRLNLALGETRYLADDIGRIEDELEQRGILVERVTERKGEPSKDEDRAFDIWLGAIWTERKA